MTKIGGPNLRTDTLGDRTVVEDSAPRMRPHGSNVSTVEHTTYVFVETGTREDLSVATDGLGQANAVLEAFNRGDGGVREGNGAGDELDEVDGGDSRSPAGSDTEATRGTSEVGDRDSGSTDVDGRTAGNGGRTRRGSVESQRRRGREVERQRREALESDDPETSEDDYEPGF